MAKVRLLKHWKYLTFVCFCWKCLTAVSIKPLDKFNSVLMCCYLLFCQVFMKSSAKKPLVWRRRIWSLVCSPTKSQKLKQYEETVLDLLLIYSTIQATILITFSAFTQVCYLMPSSSPRCAQFPRAQDKVHFYIKLKELRDQMKGLVPSREVEETQYSFNLQLAKGKQLERFSSTAHTQGMSVIFIVYLNENQTPFWWFCSTEDAKRIAIKEEQVDPEYESCSGLNDNPRQSSNVTN